MKSVPLTGAMRDEIVRNAMKGAFDAELKKARAAVNDAALDAYNEAIPPEKQKLMKQLGNEFFGVRDKISFGYCVEGHGHNVSHCVTVQMHKGMMLPFNAAAWQQAIEISKEAHDKITAAMRAEESVKQQREELRQKIEGIVRSVKTTRRLVEIWPEAEAFIPEEAAASENLPSVIVGDINAMLARAKSANAETVQAAA